MAPNGCARGKAHGAPPGRRSCTLEPDPTMSVPGLAGVEIGTASRHVDLARPRARRADGAAPRPQGQRAQLDGPRRVARRGGHPRRGDPPGAAARPDLRAARWTAREAHAAVNADIRVSDDPARGAPPSCSCAGGRPRRAHGRLDAARGVRARGRRCARTGRGVDVWFTDERCVPPDHEHSNFRHGRTTRCSPTRRGRDRAPHARRARAGGRARPPTRASSASSAPERARPDPARHRARTRTSARCFPGDDALGERERRVVGVETPGMAPLVSRITLTLPVVNASAPDRLPRDRRGQGRGGRARVRRPARPARARLARRGRRGGAARRRRGGPPVTRVGARPRRHGEPVPADRGLRLPVRLRDVRARRAERRTSSGCACRASTRRASSARCSTATPAASASARPTSRCPPRAATCPGTKVLETSWGTQRRLDHRARRAADRAVAPRGRPLAHPPPRADRLRRRPRPAADWCAA